MSTLEQTVDLIVARWKAQPASKVDIRIDLTIAFQNYGDRRYNDGFNDAMKSCAQAAHNRGEI